MTDHQLALFISFGFVWGWFCAVTFGESLTLSVVSSGVGGFIAFQVITHFF